MERVWRGGFSGRLEDGPYAVFNVDEEVVDQGLLVISSMWRWKGTQAYCEHPDVQVGDGEPRLKSRW